MNNKFIGFCKRLAGFLKSEVGATNYPGSLDSYTTKSAGDTIQESHVNDMQDAIKAIEAKLRLSSQNVESRGIQDADGDTMVQVEEGGSDEDKIRMDTAGTERFNMDSTGTTMVTQAAFMAHPTSAQANFAINADITVIFGTERFDQGSNFASNTFTAPKTGKYQLNTSLTILGADQSADYYILKIITTNYTYQSRYDPGQLAGDPTYLEMSMSVLANMNATDTAYVAIYQGSGAAAADIDVYSYFSGFLAC